MVKFSSILILSSLAFFQMSACASHSVSHSDESLQPSESSHLMNIPESQHAVPPKKLWTRKSPGLLTDLNISRDGSTVLVATVPDRDSVEVGANRSKNYAAIYSKEGRLLSQVEMPAQIKSQAISSDGSLVVIATYDDEIRGYDRAGKQLWEYEGICKPFVLSSLRKILCFHDDDSEPELAFEVLDWQGTKVASFPVKLDSLMIKVSENEKYFVVGLNHGKVLLFDSSFKPMWQKSVDGELTDLAISSPESIHDKGGPVVGVLYNIKKPAKKHKTPQLSAEQKITLFSSSKKPDAKPFPVHGRLDELELSPDGSMLFGYGNDSDGQVIARFAMDSGDLTWKRGDPKPAEYSSILLAGMNWLWVGFEDMSATTRHSHVLGFDSEGKLKSNVTVPAEEGSYLYSYSFADQANILAVGSDDGQLSLFSF